MPYSSRFALPPCMPQNEIANWKLGVFWKWEFVDGKLGPGRPAPLSKVVDSFYWQSEMNSVLSNVCRELRYGYYQGKQRYG